MQRKNRLDWGGARCRVLEPQTILPTVPRILFCPHAAPPHPHLWATTGKGKVQERTEGQSPKISHCPNLVCGVRGAAGSRAQTQTTEFKGMALDRVPKKVGIVGYGRLGESLIVRGLSPGPFLEPQKPVSSTNIPFISVLICGLADSA